MIATVRMHCTATTCQGCYNTTRCICCMHCMCEFWTGTKAVLQYACMLLISMQSYLCKQHIGCITLDVHPQADGPKKLCSLDFWSCIWTTPSDLYLILLSCSHVCCAESYQDAIYQLLRVAVCRVIFQRSEKHVQCPPCLSYQDCVKAHQYCT